MKFALLDESASFAAEKRLMSGVCCEREIFLQPVAAFLRNTMQTFHRSLVVLIALLVAPAMVLGEPVSPPKLQAVEVEVDLGALASNEKAALARIVHAARRLDALYMRQVWPGTAALLKDRTPPRDDLAAAERDALNFFKGPWDQQGRVFLAGAPATRPIGDFYPADATKAEIEAWLATLSSDEATRARSEFTAIRRGPDGRLFAEGYSHFYSSELHLVAEDLRAAAALTHEPTLTRFLQTRAQALLDDNYYESDVAFVGLRGPIDVVVGPYEGDDDEWFGVKTAFNASVALVDKSATEHTRKIASHLQELEDHLPLSPQLRGRKLGAAAPVVVLNVIYHGGMPAAGGARVGYGLPNDLRVINDVGARTGTYSNLLEIRYKNTFVPIANAVLDVPDNAALHFEDVREEILLVRLLDSLGPQVVSTTQQPIAAALQETSPAASQIRSMLLSLWAHRYLIERGYLDAHEKASLYSAFLVPALARIRGGLGSSPAQGSTYVLNRLLDAHAILSDANGHFKIDSARADAEITRAANEFISAMATGDVETVRALLRRYVVIRPEVQSAIDHMGPAPPLQRFVYRTADDLDVPHRGL